MKKLILFLLLVPMSFLFAQKGKGSNTSVPTYEMVEKSNDTKLLAQFIKANPNHPQTSVLKSRLIDLVTGNSASTKEPSRSGVQSASPKGNKSSSIAASNAAANVVNHLFNNDPNKKEAYVQIYNKSNCPMTIHFKGKKKYLLEIKGKGNGYLLLDKGSYLVTSDICSAPYSSSKNITQDISITFGK